LLITPGQKDKNMIRDAYEPEPTPGAAHAALRAHFPAV
jgi:hypothetical protein